MTGDWQGTRVTGCDAGARAARHARPARPDAVPAERGLDKNAGGSQPVYDGHKLYDVQAKLAAASEKVSVPAGDYTASKIGIRVFDDGVEMKDASFTLYFANNAARTPVLLEAVMPFARRARGALKAK